MITHFKSKLIKFLIKFVVVPRLLPNGRLGRLICKHVRPNFCTSGLNGHLHGNLSQGYSSSLSCGKRELGSLILGSLKYDRLLTFNVGSPKGYQKIFLGSSLGSSQNIKQQFTLSV